ncbi:MAG: GNAT family N-acetyltransferase [Actinobacteria bacterium]|nr:GNAT family N-acetyltransferase [Actinomycetota bacterium]
MTHPVQGAPLRACSSSLRLPQFGAEVLLDCAPQEYAEELNDRYGSFFTTVEYLTLYTRPPNYNACLLERPRHDILFALRGHTVDILNRLVDIEPEALELAAEAIFAACPAAHRIRAEVKFPPARIRRCHRVTQASQDMVVDLPADVDAYHRQIGNTTRKHLRQYGNKLRREHPEFELRRLEDGDIPLELVQQTVAWTNERVRAKGGISVYEEDPSKVRPLWQLLQRHGLALTGYIDGELAATQLLLCVGRDTWIHTVGFDSRFEKLHLGLLMTYYSIVESIERGCRRTHMLFGTPIYKQRLGAKPVTAWEVSLFRTPADKAVYMREVSKKAWRDRQKIYWSARHWAASAARGAYARLRRDSRTGGTGGEAPGGS